MYLKRKISKFSLISTLLITLIALTNVNAQNESDFYTPSTGGITKNLVKDYNVDNNFNTNDSQKLQQAINDVNSFGGGKIIIPEGNYSFAKIIMKSNVHLEINSNAIIRPANVTSGNYSIFDFGNFQANTINNVSIIGIGGRFKVDLRNVVNTNVFVFTFSNVFNFKIANFHIYDKNTIFQSLGFGHTTVGNTHYVPNKGLIKNGHAENTHYGYGLIQVQAGKNILFKNLSETGGVTLRLESGWSVMNKIQPASKTPKIENIYGRDIRCSNGQAAVFLMPHTIDQGYVNIKNITATACEFAVKTEKGWVNEKKYAGLGLTEGSFSSNSIITDVKATYGDNAEVRPIMHRFIPCNLRNKIGASGDDNEMSIAPSCAPVGDFAAGLWRGVDSNDPGSYRIKFSNIQSNGFQNSVKDIIDSDHCDYESCTNKVWIPADSRNTNGNCGTESNYIPTNNTPPNSNDVPIGSTIWLRSKANNKYISADNNITNIPLEAKNSNVETKELFQIVDAGENFIALKNNNNQYVVAEKNIANIPLRANRIAIGDWEKFTWVSNNDGTISLKANSNKKYVRVQNNLTNAPLRAIGNSIQAWEKFTWGLPSTNNKTSNNKITNNKNQILIFPNPAQNVINIDLSKKLNDNAHIEIYSLDEKLLLNNKITNTKQNISIINLKPGFYILKVYNSDQIVTKKFIKK